MTGATSKRATLYRMVMKDHVCWFGLKANDLPRREGYTVHDKWLTTREETDAFKVENEVQTTPQTFIDGKRIGGYNHLRRFFGKTVSNPNATSYLLVVAVFAMTALMATAASYAVCGSPFSIRNAEWFIAFGMCVLALLKLQNF